MTGAVVPLVTALLGGDVQCSHAVEPLTSASWRYRSAEEAGRDVAFCLRTATHAVEGRNFCQLHAGNVLLVAAMAQNSASALQTAWSSVPTLPSIEFSEVEASALIAALPPRKAAA